jgi:hypothetical protein
MTKALRRSTLVLFSWLYVWQATAQPLQIGHYVTSIKDCSSPSRVGLPENPAGWTESMWMRPDGNFWNGVVICKRKGAHFVCPDPSGDSPDSAMSLYISSAGDAFDYRGMHYSKCPTNRGPIGQSKLPMRIGIYVRIGVSCINPVYADLQGYWGNMLSYGHGTCNITNVEQAGGTFRVKTECFDPDATKPDLVEQEFTIKKGAAFNVRSFSGPNDANSTTSYRWCGPDMDSLEPWSK